MFCPNCGTKNPETATTCSKCGFNIKGAAAPKFKGTMLMMNQSIPQRPAPAAQPPGPPAPAPAAPQPAAMPAVMPKPSFKGTMVGVAPPAGFPFGPPGPAAGPPPAQHPPANAGYGGASPTLGSPGGYSPPEQPQGYGAPGTAQGHPAGVNPLGGTVAIDQMGAGYAPPMPAGYGPPAQAPRGAPPGHEPAPPAWGAPTDYGPPPGGYGPPPGAGYGPPPEQQGYGHGHQPPPPAGYGPPPGGYAPAPGGYGPPQAAGYGAPRGYGGGPFGDAAMVPTPGAGLAPTPYSSGGMAAAKTKLRNPLVVMLLSFGTFGIYGIIVMYSLMAELKQYLGREEIVPWHILVPILNLVIILTKLPGWVTEAKQRAGSRNPQSAGPLLYLLLLPYFFTKDMNEVHDPTAITG